MPHTNLNKLLTLWLCRDVGARRISSMLADKNLDAVIESPSAYQKKYQLSDRAVYDLRHPNQHALAQHLLWADNKQNHLVSLLDDHYPPLLKEIYDPPTILCVKGNIDLLKDPQIAVVGSRQMSYYGQDNTDIFVTGLVQSGLTVTSGLAYGVDARAHMAAMKASGETIAVFGTGIDQVYPHAHQAIAEDIIKHNGALITEYPLTTGVYRANFPRRNRIVTGLSLGVLVIEAGIKSGSLISARLGMEQGREVFAIPGPIHSMLTAGTHALIGQGAKLVTSTNDIFAELAIPISMNLKNSAKNSLQKRSRSDKNDVLDTEDALFLACIDSDQTPVDIIIKRSNLEAKTVSSKLLALEIEGYVKKVPGGYIRRRYP